MPKLLVALVVLLAAVAVFQALETQTLRTEVSLLRGEVEDLARSGFGTGQDVAEAEPETLPGRYTATAPPEDDAPAPATLSGPSADSATVVRAVRALQDRVEAQERRLGGVEEKVEKTPRPRTLANRRMIRNLDQAESVLDLTPRQREDLARVVEDAKRDLEDLRNLPDDEGMTLAQVGKPKVVEGDGVTISMPDFGKVQRFRNQTVPGRNETYREAEARIQKQAKQRIRDLLEPEQRKTWDQSWTHGLLGPSTPGVAFVSSSIGIGSRAKDD